MTIQFSCSETNETYPLSNFVKQPGESKSPAALTLTFVLLGSECFLAWFFKDCVGRMALADPTKGTLIGADWGNNHLMCLVNNHVVLLLGLTLVARTLMGVVQTAGFVRAGALELQEFSLPNPQYSEQAFYPRATRLEFRGFRHLS